MLVVCCAPALAATGLDVLCDRSSDQPVSLVVSVEELTINVVDHGSANSMAAGESAATEILPPSAVSVNPSVETILRQIFDESAPAGQESAEATAAGAANAVSLAELTAPTASDKSVELAGADDTGDVNSEESSSVVNTQLQGVPDDQILRYRRQMYRTDI